MAEDHSWEAQEKKLLNYMIEVVKKLPNESTNSVIGARPQFIKAAVVSNVLKTKGINEFLFIRDSILMKICPRYFLKKWVFLSLRKIWNFWWHAWVDDWRNAC